MKIVFGLLVLVHYVAGHARLIQPPSRASMWRFGFPNPPDYNDNQGFCGGVRHQFDDMGGKCGICGDAWDDLPRQHEAPNGRYANGIIAQDYHPGQIIDAVIDVTANHYGYFYFKLCPNNNIRQDPTQECFDAYPLQVVSDSDGSLVDRYYLPDKSTRKFPVKVQLPTGLACDQCILQWTYHAENSWGTDPDGTSGIGYGAQEHFRACSDISINGDSKGSTMRPTPGSTTPTTPSTTKFDGQLVCQALPPYDVQDNMHKWCTDNCNLGSCPSNMCSCQAVKSA